jgi:hypothetical protein
MYRKELVRAQLGDGRICRYDAEGSQEWEPSQPASEYISLVGVLARNGG